MKAKTITAKLRDAVPVCFMVNGDEMTRYRNIDIPESLKDLEIQDFGFQILADGKIEFNLHFDQGILPTEFPGIRPKITRAEKAAIKAQFTAEAVKSEDANSEAAPIIKFIHPEQEATGAQDSEGTMGNVTNTSDAVIPMKSEIDGRVAVSSKTIQRKSRQHEST